MQPLNRVFVVNTAGERIYLADAAADDAVGADGDYWFNVVDIDRQGPKASGTWPAVSTGILAPINAPVFTGIVQTPYNTAVRIGGVDLGGTGINVYHPGHGAMILTGATMATGETMGFYNIPTVTGAASIVQGFQIAGDVNGNLLNTVFNSRTTGGTGNAVWQAQAGAGGGDALFRAVINGGATWTAGVDQTDNEYKINPSANLGSGDFFTITAGGGWRNATTQTVQGGSTSGSVTYSQPLQGASWKKVIAYCNALVGTASYTFPTAFTNTPAIVTTNGPAAGVVTALSTTAVTITGATTTGLVILEGY